ncbi:MAG TPA: maleylpyruvate isomerase N-terminal domain-containing protein [Pseudonocardiaceae bacterium]|jgi:hypothetical protein|nr:maleylpyruvate isomerase N-terminal domain-containing protein [Pseudonocardiaceae bacterium]
MTITADDLDAALAGLLATVGVATDRDWKTVAGTGEWDCRHTAEHLGDCLLSYAAQLVARPADRYVRFQAAAEKDASAAEVLEFAVTGGGILAAAVRSAAADVRAYHPMGNADPEGFAAMGCAEALLHGEDMARGLGLHLEPSRDLCTRVLARLFPHVDPGSADTDSWSVLQWATGRLDLPDRERPTRWRWYGAPRQES